MIRIVIFAIHGETIAQFRPNLHASQLRSNRYFLCMVATFKLLFMPRICGFLDLKSWLMPPPRRAAKNRDDTSILRPPPPHPPTLTQILVTQIQTWLKLIVFSCHRYTGNTHTYAFKRPKTTHMYIGLRITNQVRNNHSSTINEPTGPTRFRFCHLQPSLSMRFDICSGAVWLHETVTDIIFHQKILGPQFGVSIAFNYDYTDIGMAYQMASNVLRSPQSELFTDIC